MRIVANALDIFSITQLESQYLIPIAMWHKCFSKIY